MKSFTWHSIVWTVLCLLLIGCRQTPIVSIDESLHFEHGLYILNEGNMGSNKATIDFYDIERDSFYRDIYPIVNPSVIKELGDVGNDIQIYGSKLYAVINVSGKVEVMDTQCRRITQIDIPNCRSLAFANGCAYVTSYAGPVDYGNPEYEQRGYVAKIDTNTLSVIDTCHVGYQPNGIACDGQMLYVANSGGYMAPRYDSTISIISLTTFKEEKRIPVAVNLDQIVYDQKHHALYVSSLGDYMSRKAELYRIGISDMTIQAMGFSCSKMALYGDSIYYYSSDMYSGANTFARFSTETLCNSPVVIENAKQLRTPYCIYVDQTGLYLTDARDYVTPGVLYRYSHDGHLVSSHRTGDIPGHICYKE